MKYGTRVSGDTFRVYWVIKEYLQNWCTGIVDDSKWRYRWRIHGMDRSGQRWEEITYNTYQTESDAIEALITREKVTWRE